MKQEPVGVVCEFEGILVGTLFEPLPDGTPLYTSPKQLSDEEILNVAFCCEVNTVAIENDWDGTVIDFAREILKKASEK